MVYLANKQHNYQIFYLATDDEEHDANVMKHLVKAVDWLNSDDGRQRIGPRIPEDVHVNVKTIHSFQDIGEHLNHSQSSAMIIIDQSIPEDDIRFLRKWTESKGVYLLRTVDTPSSKTPDGNFAEASANILTTKNHHDLHDELATGVMYHHSRLHESQAALSP